LRARAYVSGDQQLLKELFPALKANYEAWEKTHLDPDGLFWQIDDRDGMEMSIGGSGYRPTINSYLFGDAMALSEIALWDWKPDESVQYRLKAEKLREMVETKLWNETARFYETLPRAQNDPDKTVNVRELIGYVPWYFNLPNSGREAAWRELLTRTVLRRRLALRRRSAGIRDSCSKIRMSVYGMDRRGLTQHRRL
jgi:glycogen debranching enzyme